MIDLSYRDIFGNLRNKQETANCYVISSPGDYCFPLIYGCGIKNSKNNSESYTNQRMEKQADFYDYQDKIIKNPEIGYHSFGAKIIVTDSSRNIIQDLKVVNNYIQLSIIYIPEGGGNFVIGVVDDNNCIIWSWHIWLWKDELKNIDIGKYKLLNINLASHRDFSGKLRNWFYQWGRKDPMCYIDSMVNIREESADCIGQAIQNPRTFFIFDPDYKKNWVKKSFFYNYWNSRCYKENVEEPVEKTIYDPCPPGYFVPGYGVFSELRINNWDDKKKGLIFKGDIFFPALGFRNGGNGLPTESGCDGYYWSSGTVSEYYASRLGFKYSVGPLELNYRANGCSVRPCLAE